MNKSFARKLLSVCCLFTLAIILTGCQSNDGEGKMDNAVDTDSDVEARAREIAK